MDAHDEKKKHQDKISQVRRFNKKKQPNLAGPETSRQGHRLYTTRSNRRLYIKGVIVVCTAKGVNQSETQRVVLS
jgi:hypothetical protein